VIPTIGSKPALQDAYSITLSARPSKVMGTCEPERLGGPYVDGQLDPGGKALGLTVLDLMLVRAR
jgi:hypothetical protein